MNRSSVDQTGWAYRTHLALRQAGYQSGAARSTIVAVLGDAGGGLTASELAQRLRDADRPTAKATIYRALGQLIDISALHGVDLGTGTVRYELVHPDGWHVHHVVCTRCGQTETFAEPALERVLDALSARSRYEVHGHDVILYGRCLTCTATNR